MTDRQKVRTLKSKLKFIKMILQRKIHGKIQDCTLIKMEQMQGNEVELVQFLYKGKEPVYMSFSKKKPIALAIEYSTLVDITRKIIRERKPEIKKFNYLKLKLILR